MTGGGRRAPRAARTAERDLPSPVAHLPSRWGVYLVTDRHQTNGRPLVDVVAAALRGGVRAVQLRERDLPGRLLLELARALRVLTRAHDAVLLINDRVDVALACEADGVHLPAASFAVRDARALLGPQRLIGVSTHSPVELATAAADGADFAVFGPVFDTPSKRPYGAPLGLDALAAARAASSLPLIAIGGITPRNAADAISAGADGVAVIRAVLGAADPASAARTLRKRLREDQRDSQTRP